MPRMISNNGWGKSRKRNYVWKWYKGLFNKSGKNRKLEDENKKVLLGKEFDI